MNKKSFIGLVLIGLIMFGYTWYSGKQASQAQAEKERIEAENYARAQAARAEQARLDSVNQAIEADPLKADSLKKVYAQEQEAKNRNQLGNQLYEAKEAIPSIFTVENDLAVYEFSTRGGILSEVSLKEYKKYGTEESVKLFVPETNKFDVHFYVNRGYNQAGINTMDYTFERVDLQTEWAEDEQTKRVVMRLKVDSTAYLDYIYTIQRDNYMIDFDIDFSNMKQLMANQSAFEINWTNDSPQNEKGFENENNYTTIAYRYDGDDEFEELDVAKEGDGEQEKLTTPVDWVAFKQQFFSSIIVADDNFSGGNVKFDTYKAGSGRIKKFSASLSVPYSSDKSVYGFRMYYGPNKFNILETYDLGFEDVVPLGGTLVGWINRWFVIPLFDFLSSRIASFGWIILIMTIVIKLVIFPLTYKSYKSSAKMRVLKPELDELNRKYPNPDDAMKKQQAMMDLYKGAGVSPMSGCLPMLIQLPILWAMFRFFPASIELRGEKLWWADDLSSYDSVVDLPFNIPFYGDHVSLFALMMSAMLIVSSLINLRNTGQQQMPGMKFMMVWMMPIMMLFFMNNYASGLCYYYFLSSLITLLLTFAIRAMIDDKKVRAQLLENAKKPRKKSRFQERYEAALKAQQEQMRQQQRRK